MVGYNVCHVPGISAGERFDKNRGVWTGAKKQTNHQQQKTCITMIALGGKKFVRYFEVMGGGYACGQCSSQKG